MRHEVFRMDNVTNESYGITQLSRFNLQIFCGEIMGLMPLNSHGVESLIALMQKNTAIHFGRVYCEEQLVNSHLYRRPEPNPIVIIEKKSHLMEGLSVADNVFILSQTDQSWLVRTKQFQQQLEVLEKAVGVHIPDGVLVERLSFFQRCIVELLKATVSGARLVVVRDVGHYITGNELLELHRAIRYFAGTGISFFYICNNCSEAADICDRVALMYDGTISKVLRQKELDGKLVAELIDQIAGVTTERIHSWQQRRDVCFHMQNVSCSVCHNLNLEIHSGECVVLHNEDQSLLDGLKQIFTGEDSIRQGTILLRGKRIKGPLVRNRDFAYIAENSAKTMLFPDLTYLDNLTFGMDEEMRAPGKRRAIHKSLQKELCEEIGGILDKNLIDLTIYEQYWLVFHRVLLQRPQIVFCEQPFFGCDIYLRSYVIELVRKLLEHGIAVVVLVVGLYDTFSLADRDLVYRNGTIAEWLGEVPAVTEL